MSRTRKKATPSKSTASAPLPPHTRAEIQAMLLRHLENEVEHSQEGMDEWRTKFGAHTKPVHIVHDLDWAQKMTEVAAHLRVYSEAFEALSAPDTKATPESVRDYAIEKVIDRARFPSRSSSPMSNQMHQNETQAWGQLAHDLRSWCMSLRTSDEYYAAQAAATAQVDASSVPTPPAVE